jgi:hypothetical protein
MWIIGSPVASPASTGRYEVAGFASAEPTHHVDHEENH